MKFSYKISIFACLLLACSLCLQIQAQPLDHWAEDTEIQELNDQSQFPVIHRHARSPQPEGGSVDLTYTQDPQNGREASVKYNQNIYTSNDGRGTIDAYAQGSRNIDANRNDYGGGIVARWSF